MKTSFKRAFGLILVLTLVCTLLFAFTACDNSDEMSALEKKVQELQNKVAGFEESTAEKAITVNIGENSYTLTTRENRMVYALSELVEKGSIATFTYAKGSYGAFITALDTLAPTGYQYIAIYHTIDNEAYKQASGTWNPDYTVFTPTGGYDTKVVNEVTYFYSSVGISSLPVIDGATYLFVIE